MKKTNQNKGRFWYKIKPLVTTVPGWFCIIVATLISYSPAWVPMLLGVILPSGTLLATGTTILVILAQPLIPMWLIIPALAFTMHTLLFGRVIYIKIKEEKGDHTHEKKII